MRENWITPLRTNADIIDALFCLMLEILWVSPYDRRRNHPQLGEFEHIVRRMVVCLSSPVVVGSERRDELGGMVVALEACFGQLVESEVFPMQRCDEATQAVMRITTAVRNLYGCETV